MTDPLQQLKQFASEPDPGQRSLLVLDRLLDHSRDSGNQFWLLSAKQLTRGFPDWIDGEIGTFLPFDGEGIPDGCFIGTTVGSAEQWWPLLEAWSPGIELDYHPSSWMEGLLAAELRTAR